MRTVIIGTSGQLALELRRGAHSDAIVLAPAQKVDVSDAASVEPWLDAERPGLVLNASAYTAVDRAETERERAFAVNAEGPGALARWCKRHGAALVHVSTDYVFDGAKLDGYRVEDAVSPLNVYGASKLAGEEHVRAELERHLILRTSWVFSAHGQNFVKTMLRLARERDELRVVADQVGRPTPAAELARVMLLVAERIAHGDALAWGTYHVAGAGSCSWHGFAEAIVAEQAELTGRRPRVVPIATQDYPLPAPRPKSSILDTASFEAAFGIELQPWRTGLRDVIRELLGTTLASGSATATQ
jgi:dTDP-4-dehydrorhamnose reductase